MAIGGSSFTVAALTERLESQRLEIAARREALGRARLRDQAAENRLAESRQTRKNDEAVRLRDAERLERDRRLADELEQQRRDDLAATRQAFEDDLIERRLAVQRRENPQPRGSLVDIIA